MAAETPLSSLQLHPLRVSQHACSVLPSAQSGLLNKQVRDSRESTQHANTWRLETDVLPEWLPCSLGAESTTANTTDREAASRLISASAPPALGLLRTAQELQDAELNLLALWRPSASTALHGTRGGCGPSLNWGKVAKTPNPGQPQFLEPRPKYLKRSGLCSRRPHAQASRHTTGPRAQALHKLQASPAPAHVSILYLLPFDSAPIAVHWTPEGHQLKLGTSKAKRAGGPPLVGCQKSRSSPMSATLSKTQSF